MPAPTAAIAHAPSSPTAPGDGASHQFVAASSVLEALGLWLPLAQFQQSEPPTQGDEDANGGAEEAAALDHLTEQQRRQLEIFGPILLNPSPDIALKTRRNAAHELIAMGLPQAYEMLESALRSDNPSITLAVASAMHAARATAPELLDAAVDAVPDASLETLDALSWVLARYGENALEKVTAMALDRTQPTARRKGPIYALAAFRNRNAAATLMQLIEPQTADDGEAIPPEAPEIIDAACASLERLSGLSYGNDPERWRAWWATARDLSPGQWFQFVARSLADRVVELQQQLHLQHAANDRMARKLYEAYLELYPELTVDEQLRRLPELLEDDVAPVREFGINRVALLLRDSVRIPPRVQAALVNRLADDVPALRLQAARLLDELNYDNVATLLANRLAVERSIEVAGGLLDILSKRSSPAAIEPARLWLGHFTLGEPAATIIWRAVLAGNVDQNVLNAVRSDVRSHVAKQPQPSLVKLLALLGDETDNDRLTMLLDGADPALRIAVAEGFCHRGARQPLLDRARDPVIYPYAVRVLLEGPADLAAMRALAELKPDDANLKTWSDAVLALARKLPVGDLLAADDILSQLAYADNALRSVVLLRVVQSPREQTTPELRIRTMAKLAPILIELGQAPRVHELLESMNSDLGSGTLRRVRFQAAALAGHYEKAAQYEPDPSAWVALLSTIVTRDPAAAGPLRDEIIRRFGSVLGEEDRALLDTASQSLDSAGTAAAAATPTD